MAPVLLGPLYFYGIHPYISGYSPEKYVIIFCKFGHEVLFTLFKGGASMYIIITFLLWGVAGLIMYMDAKNPKNRWLALTAFTGGLIGLQSLLQDIFLPILLSFTSGNIRIEAFIYNLSTLFWLTSQFYLVFLFMFSLNYVEVKKINIQKNQFKYLTILLIPFVIWYVLITRSIFGDYPEPNPWLVATLSIIYVSVSNLILIIGFIKEENKRLIEERIALLYMVTPVTIASVVFGDIYYAIGDKDAWKNEITFFIYLFIMFSFFAIRRGFMGIKIRVDKVKMERDSNLLLNNTVFLNHTLKNEIVKIAKSVENINTTNKEVEENINTIKASVKHLQAMVDRVNSKTRDFHIRESICSLNEVFQDIINENFHANDIDVKVHLQKTDIKLLCDGEIIREALASIIQNSYEAIRAKGNIWIAFELKKGYLKINIKDDGIGLSAPITAKIFDPYFTTKASAKNIGLGLTYSRKAIEKHKGNIEIDSIANKGTTVSICLPAERVVNYKNLLP